jgi:hypothetical protein
LGTFHHDRHFLHGTTVVVETQGGKIYVGRCDDIDHEHILLLDADVHDEAASGRSKEEYLSRAVAVGFWARHARVSVPSQEAVSIRRLGDL